MWKCFKFVRSYIFSTLVNQMSTSKTDTEQLSRLALHAFENPHGHQYTFLSNKTKQIEKSLCVSKMNMSRIISYMNYKRTCIHFRESFRHVHDLHYNIVIVILIVLIMKISRLV